MNLPEFRWLLQEMATIRTIDNTIFFICARDGNRTRTLITENRILSPARLPIPPPERDCKNMEFFGDYFVTASIVLAIMSAAISICSCVMVSGGAKRIVWVWVCLANNPLAFNAKHTS